MLSLPLVTDEQLNAELVLILWQQKFSLLFEVQRWIPLRGLTRQHVNLSASARLLLCNVAVWRFYSG